MAYYYNQDFLESLSGKGMPLDNIFVEDIRDGLGKTRISTGFALLYS